ncbi:hypothetical protein DSM25558_2443 [Agrobacterium sp. DSM 25558]|nr:hypothetical protein DSM25558_2443 [Agrobacterium sp. DSM 25558]
MPDLVLRADNIVPIRDQRLIVICHVGKGPTINSKNAGVAEMRIGREEDHRL